MTRLFLILGSICLLGLQAKASNNPDAGKLMRLVCYSSTVADDASSRIPDLTILIEQNSTSPIDASFLIVGNDNYYDHDYPGRGEFTIRIYRDVDLPTGDVDPMVYSEELLAMSADHEFVGVGWRAEEAFSAEWYVEGVRNNFLDGHETIASKIRLRLGGTSSEPYPISCDPPFSVPAPE